MKAAVTFFQLVSLVMAALSLLPLAVVGLLGPSEPVAFEWPIGTGIWPTFLRMVTWHHELYWDAAFALGIAREDAWVFGIHDYVLFLAIHGTNVLLGFLSVRAIWRTPSGGDVVAIGPAASYVLPYVQRAALWILQAVTAGVLGNYAWKLIDG